MKKLCTLFSVLLLAAAAYGQTTVASATIIDSTGQVWFGGTYTITFVPAAGFQGPYYFNGCSGQSGQFNPQIYNGVLDGSGHFSITLADNKCLTPTGSQWLFVLCAQTIAKCSQLTRTVTGATEDFTTDFSANVTPPIFATGLLSYGYSTAEVQPIPLPGGFFFNVTNSCQEVWNGTTWYLNCGSGGGGICGNLGFGTPGTICYSTGSAWVLLPGNEGSELFLSETSGVPAWEPSAGAVSAEDVPTLMGVPSQCHYPSRCTNSDVPFTLFPASDDYVFKVPPNSTYGSSAMVQDCVMTNLGAPPQNSCTCTHSYTGTTVTISCTIPHVYPGDSIVTYGAIECGLGCSQFPTFTDSNSNSYTPLDPEGNNGGASLDGITVGVAGNYANTVTATFTSINNEYYSSLHVIEMRGITGITAHGGTGNNSGPVTSFPSVTTTGEQAILAFSFDNTYLTTGCGYSAGTGYQIYNQDAITNGSFGDEGTIVTASNTYTPTITRNNCTVGAGTAQTLALAYTGSTTGSDILWPQRLRFSTLVVGGDFDPLAAGTGLFSPDGQRVSALTFGTGLTLTGSILSASAAGVGSIQFENAGVDYGSPMTGSGSMNFVGGVVSGTAPNFTITTGTVTSVSSGNFSPLFNVNVATPTTTPAFTFTALNFLPDRIFGNFTASSAPPSTQQIPACANDGLHALSYPSHTLTCSALATNGGGVNTQTSNYTLQSTDTGKLVVMNCGSACSLTMLATPGSTFRTCVQSIGTDTATINLNSLDYNGSTSVPVLINYFPMCFYSDGTNYFGDTPPVAGTGVTVTGASNGATISSTTTGTVTSVSGTANQIDVATGTTTPVISLDSAITFPGTITMGAHAADFSSATSFKPPGGGGTFTVGTANINWATLGTGVVLNTTTTGAKAVIAAVGTKCYPYQGSSGTGCDTPSSLPSGTGVVRVDSSVGSAAELSGDATTSGSNAVTVNKIHGGSTQAAVNYSLAEKAIDSAWNNLSSAAAQYFSSAYSGTIPANWSGTTAGTSGLSCKTNPSATITWTIKDETTSTTLGTFAITSGGSATLTTTGGTTATVTAVDVVSVTPSATDSSAIGCVFTGYFTVTGP